MQSGTVLSIALPTITVGPSGCHTIASYEVLDTGSSLTPSFVTVTPTSVDVASTDKAMVGSHDLSISAVTNHNEKVQAHTFTVEITDACQTTSLIEMETPEATFEVDIAGAILTKQVQAYQDVFSNAEGVQKCGEVSFELLDANDSAAPAFVTVSHASGATTYTLSVDPSTLTNKEARTYFLKLVVKLTDYFPTVPQVSKNFSVVVKPFVE